MHFFFLMQRIWSCLTALLCSGCRGALIAHTGCTQRDISIGFDPVGADLDESQSLGLLLGASGDGAVAVCTGISWH